MQYKELLNQILSQAQEGILSVPLNEFNAKPLPNKWSKKEILGHLIDSAYNNHERFLRAKDQGDLVFPGYDPDEWVRQNNYQNRTGEDVYGTFRTTNEHIGFVVAGLSKELLNRRTSQHNFHAICQNELKENELSSLSYLVWDYLFHLEYHLSQIIPTYQKLVLPFEES